MALAKAMVKAKLAEKLPSAAAQRAHARRAHHPPGRGQLQVNGSSRAGKGRAQAAVPLARRPADLGHAAHALAGKDFTFTAVLPDEEQTRIPLIRIDRWNFNWQGTYAFAEPIRLPKGAWLEMEAHFDNTAENPVNPHSPPKVVCGGTRPPTRCASASSNSSPLMRTPPVASPAMRPSPPHLPRGRMKPGPDPCPTSPRSRPDVVIFPRPPRRPRPVGAGLGRFVPSPSDLSVGHLSCPSMPPSGGPSSVGSSHKAPKPILSCI